MNLAQATEAIRTRMASNIRKIGAIVIWLQQNPNCRWDMRRDRLELWNDLRRECDRLARQWKRAREQWVATRMNEEA